LPPETDPSLADRGRDGRDDDLVREVLHGGLPGEHAGLELLLRRRPECWEDALALLDPDVAPRHAFAALAEAWRAYRRIQRTEAAPRQ
jgi:hypothetical protein